MVEISKETIKAYALENAIKYGGKANIKAVASGAAVVGIDKSEIKDYMEQIGEVVNQVNSMDLEEQKREFENLKYKVSKREVRVGLPELSNAEEGKVVMRFAPFPSGPLHIGNARPLILNDEYVKKYHGKLLLIMDDTIGSEEKPIVSEAYGLIEEGMKWLEVNYDKKIVYRSDRIEKYYEYAEELIKKGYMYVCNCTREQIRDLRVGGVECSCRQFSFEEQLRRWKEMFTAKEGTSTVRLKTNMQDPDPAFRDRVMFKISDRTHARVGKKFRVYPLLDFSAAIDDHVFGITNILMGTELTNETRVEKFIWDIFGWKHPEVIYNGNFEIEGVKISKSKSAVEVRSNEYSGWNDPRTWSLQSLRDRGFVPGSIREFILNMGIKKANITIPVDVLYTINKKRIIDAPKFFFVENPLEINIKGTPNLTARIPMDSEGKLDEKIYATSQHFLISENDFNLMKNGNYRLMHLLNFKSEKIFPTRPREFSFLSEEPDKDLDVKYLHWLPAGADNVKIKIRMSDGNYIEGLGEPNVRKLLAGSIVQFERFGFVKLYKKEKDVLEFWFAHN